MERIIGVVFQSLPSRAGDIKYLSRTFLETFQQPFQNKSKRECSFSLSARCSGWLILSISTYREREPEVATEKLHSPSQGQGPLEAGCFRYKVVSRRVWECEEWANNHSPTLRGRKQKSFWQEQLILKSTQPKKMMFSKVGNPQDKNAATLKEIRHKRVRCEGEAV